MNGEPRDVPPTSIPGEQPLLEPVNIDGVTQTAMNKEDGKLAALFTQQAATNFRSRWDLVQRSFVDNPLEAVRAGDELVEQVIQSLGETFSNQRTQLEVNQSEQSSTENLRLALRRYRSFFERLLSI